jgi:hypothetical protein
VSTQGLDQEEGTAVESHVVVFGGLHDGARDTLTVGAHLVGRGDHCSLKLLDPDVPHEWLLVSVEARGGVHVTVLSGGCSTSLSLKNPVPQGTRLECSRPARFDLGAISLGVLAGVPKAQLAEQSAKLLPTADDALLRRLGVRYGAEPMHAGLGSSGVRSKSAAVMALGGAFLFLAGTLTGLARLNTAEAMQPVALNKSQVLAQLQAAGFDDLVVGRTATDVLQVEGYLPTSQALSRAKQAIPASQVQWSVHVVEELERISKSAFAEKGLRVQVDHRGKGVFVVTGADAQSPAAHAVGGKLVADFPGIVKVDTPVMVAAQPNPNHVGGSSDAKASEPLVLSGFTGINAGHKVPYITSGGSYIFNGGTLRNGLSIVDISESSIKVTQPGRQVSEDVFIQQRGK